MINRYQYMAHIGDCSADISAALQADGCVVEQCIKSGNYYTVAVYRFADTLYMYCETEHVADGNELFPSLTKLLDDNGWRLMDNVYYTSIPVSAEFWRRKPGKERLCRIGRLVPDKIESYIKYHRLFMVEGIRKGDKYLCIALLDKMLFLYYETPVEPACLRTDKTGESQVQQEWVKQDPVGHFDHDFSGEANFIDLNAIFSMGREDIYDE